MQISQETEFDHRQHKPIAFTTSNSNGDWNFEGIKLNDFNIVLEKQGFGWIKICEKNKSSLNQNFYLKKAINLRGIVTNQLDLDENFLVIEDNTVLNENSAINFFNKNQFRGKIVK